MDAYLWKKLEESFNLDKSVSLSFSSTHKRAASFTLASVLALLAPSTDVRLVQLVIRPVRLCFLKVVPELLLACALINKW